MPTPNTYTARLVRTRRRVFAVFAALLAVGATAALLHPDHAAKAWLLALVVGVCSAAAVVRLATLARRLAGLLDTVEQRVEAERLARLAAEVEAATANARAAQAEVRLSEARRGYLPSQPKVVR